MGLNIFAGMILAELSMISTPKPQFVVSKALPYALVVLGLYLCSFPSEYYDQTPWSAQLAAIGRVIFPAAGDMGRFWAGIGAQIVCLGVFLSPSLRSFFSQPYLLSLGSLSYPLYLLHGPLMRSLLTYMLYLPGAVFWQPVLLPDGLPDPEAYIPDPSLLRLCLTIPVFALILLLIVRWWAAHVEPRLGAATDSLEVFARSWGKEPLALPSLPKDNDASLLPIAEVRDSRF